MISDLKFEQNNDLLKIEKNKSKKARRCIQKFENVRLFWYIAGRVESKISKILFLSTIK